MNSFSQVLGTVALAAIGFAGHPAFAQEATPDYPQPFTSKLTRDQVIAELAQARRDGSMRVWSTTYNHIAAAKSLKSRSEVQSETMGPDRAEMAAMQGEDSGSFVLSRKAVRYDPTRFAGRQ